MFDYNCDIVYGNDSEFEIAKYCSTINISSVFNTGISKAFEYAQNHNVAIAALIDYPEIQGFGKRKIVLDDNELEALIIYQIGAILAYAKTKSLEIETIRPSQMLSDEINNNEKSAITIVNSIKKISPWFNLIVQNQNTKDLVQSNGLKAALEFNYNDNTISEIKQMEQSANFKIDTLHFDNLEDIKKAHLELNPTPINYNRVQAQL